ncbi:hypothetical protein AAMO2058_000883800 [Amorphochlora amoebiformis]
MFLIRILDYRVFPEPPRYAPTPQFRTDQNKAYDERKESEMSERFSVVIKDIDTFKRPNALRAIQRITGGDIDKISKELWNFPKVLMMNLSRKDAETLKSYLEDHDIDVVLW